MEGPGTDEAEGKKPRQGRRVIEQPPITRKAAADQVGKSECGAGKGHMHLFHKKARVLEIILLIDILSSSARGLLKSEVPPMDGEGDITRRSQQKTPHTHTSRPRKELRIDTGHTEVTGRSRVSPEVQCTCSG